MQSVFRGIAERLMRCPAAPYHEALVAAEARRICAEHRLSCTEDRFGNLLVQAAPRLGPNPLVLAAHMDHPGFELQQKISDEIAIARFLGSVGEDYFRPGTPLLLMPGRVRAALGKRSGEKEREYEIQSRSAIPSTANYAVWDLPEFESENGLLRGRVCDDLIGVATILTVLIELRGTRPARNMMGVLSRAEEVGFQGALALARSKKLPTGSVIISLETSRELPPAKMGAGVIIRVGDRASIFDSDATRFLSEVATDLQKRDRDFHFQRALMSGGTCEATAYQEYGYRSAAVCVALGNYHNCGSNNKIRAEYVSESDALSMATLLVESAKQWPRAEKFSSRLLKRLDRLAREGERELSRKTLKTE